MKRVPLSVILTDIQHLDCPVNKWLEIIVIFHGAFLIHLLHFIVTLPYVLVSMAIMSSKFFLYLSVLCVIRDNCITADSIQKILKIKGSDVSLVSFGSDCSVCPRHGNDVMLILGSNKFTITNYGQPSNLFTSPKWSKILVLLITIVLSAISLLPLGE